MKWTWKNLEKRRKGAETISNQSSGMDQKGNEMHIKEEGTKLLGEGGRKKS